MRSGNVGRLAVSAVKGTHERAARHVRESRLSAGSAELLEADGLDEPLHREMSPARTEVLVLPYRHRTLLPP